jgi:hypothetical protein
MRSIRFHSALRPVRFFVAVCICALLVFSHTVPAYSAPVNPTGSKTVPQEGEAQLRGIEREAQEAVQKDPYSRQETQAKANAGLNEVQGTADFDKMNRPENSQEATSVADKLKQALEAVAGKLPGAGDREPVEEKVSNAADRIGDKVNDTTDRIGSKVSANLDRVNPTGNKTAPQQGEAQLRGIEREAQAATQKDPYSRQETQAKANAGLNEIQGTADLDKMSRPENSQGASSVEDKVKQTLEGLTGK